MAEHDAQIATGANLPRLGELGRAIARGIRGALPADERPSFAASLVAASRAQGSEETRGGRPSGDPRTEARSAFARAGRDRATVDPTLATLTPTEGPRTLTGAQVQVPQAGAQPPAPGSQPHPPAPAPVASGGGEVPPQASGPGAAQMPASVPAASSTPASVQANAQSTSGPAAPAGGTSWPVAPYGSTPTPYGSMVAPYGSTVTPYNGAATSVAPYGSTPAPASQASAPLASAQPVAASARDGGPAAPRQPVSPAAVPERIVTGSEPPVSGTPVSAVEAGASTASGLALKEYPKPSRSDRSGVLGWASAVPPSRGDTDRLIAEAKRRQVGWVTFVVDPGQPEAYDDLVKRLTRAGIQPIARVQDQEGDLPSADVGAVAKHLRERGVRYFQLFDGANVVDESPDGRVDVGEYADRWLAAARAVVAAGGLPGLGALDPHGDYDDLGYQRQLLSAIKERGGADALGRSWVAMRGETPGASAGEDELADLGDRAEWYDRLSRRVLGRSLPILVTVDPAGRPERLPRDPATGEAPSGIEQAERTIRDRRRKVPAFFAASRGTLEASRA